MDLHLLRRKNEFEWEISPQKEMRVPAIIFGSEDLVQNMDTKVYEQIVNVASLPGIVKAAYVMPDAHWGYGFPVGGVAAFDPNEGVVSAGGVGFDISCGVRLLKTGLTVEDIAPIKTLLADALFEEIPAGVGSRSSIRLDQTEIDRMLSEGARWALSRGYALREDLERIEEGGTMRGATPQLVSERAKERQKNEIGTLGSGNHYLEIQEVTEIYDEIISHAFGLHEKEVVISIHCGSRGLGHQIGTEFLKLMAMSAEENQIKLPDRELACAPIQSDLGQTYLGVMRAAINCALANRQVLTYFARQVFKRLLPKADLKLVYDVSHNTCKEEWHEIDGQKKRLFVHRKGATRSFGPNSPDLPADFRKIGQPVVIGGSMGTSSYVLAGTETSEELSMGSSCHGAGRAMSRTQALKIWNGKRIVHELATRGIFIRSSSMRGIAEEAPEAYKNVSSVVEAAHRAGLSKKVARLSPLVCVKG
ncbi:MAG: hypothetical protein JWQ35_564 [Bacteriovoracaceae bacterium]|nr:hypothetical protein [Bacteriovoracaceae bacterium]